jgi:hypothetical protein
MPAGPCLKLTGLNLAIWIARVDQEADCSCAGNELAQQLYSLRYQRAAEEGHSRDVAAPPIQACYQTMLDWIAADHKHNRDRCGRRLYPEWPGHGAGGDDHRHPTANELGPRHAAQDIANRRITLRVRAGEPRSTARAGLLPEAGIQPYRSLVSSGPRAAVSTCNNTHHHQQQKKTRHAGRKGAGGLSTRTLRAFQTRQLVSA